MLCSLSGSFPSRQGRADMSIRIAPLEIHGCSFPAMSKARFACRRNRWMMALPSRFRMGHWCTEAMIPGPRNIVRDRRRGCWHHHDQPRGARRRDRSGLENRVDQHSGGHRYALSRRQRHAPNPAGIPVQCRYENGRLGGSTVLQCRDALFANNLHHLTERLDTLAEPREFLFGDPVML